MNNEIDMEKSYAYCRDCLHLPVCDRWPSLTCSCLYKLRNERMKNTRACLDVLEDEAMTIKVEHENGFAGILYGKSSMAIYGPDGHEVLHTGSRNVNTKEELQEILAKMPDFVNKMKEIIHNER